MYAKGMCAGERGVGISVSEVVNDIHFFIRDH